jgi:uncharacterized protein YndB with AHSA1/START domain
MTAQTQKEIKHTWYFNQSVQEVWDYLTKPELIEQWLMKSNFKPVVGHKFQFINNSKIDAYCQVLEIVPQKLLSFSWKKGKSEQEFTIDSVVTWTLTAKDGGTELQLQHNGFTLLDDAIAHTKGWSFCIGRMIALINFPSNANTNA